MPDPSTPNPSDPEKADSKSADNQDPKKRLKLKRIIIEDVEINPRKKPDSEPTPEAKPYEEPEEEPVPDLSLIAGDVQHPGISSPAIPVKPQVEAREPGHASMRYPDDLEPKPSALPTAAPRQGSPLRKAAVFLLVLAVVSTVVVLGLKILNPLKGEGKPDLAGNNAPDEPAASQETPPVAPKINAKPYQGKPLVSAEWNLQEFLHALESQQISASTNPKGIFVGSVFIPEGSPVNPELGLTLSSVTLDPDQPVAILSGRDGQEFTLTIASVKK